MYLKFFRWLLGTSEAESHCFSVEVSGDWTGPLSPCSASTNISVLQEETQQDRSLWEQQLPCCKDTQAALGLRMHVERSHPVNNQYWLALHVSEPPWSWVLQPQSSLQSTEPQLTSWLQTHVSQKHPAKLHKTALTYRNWDYGFYYCFKPLNFGAICYATVAD